MKQFLIASFSSALLLGTSFEAQAEQIWVNGVTPESGWIDYDKSRSDNDDDLLCWAASASCVLDYWQSLYITSYTIPTGEDIWERFKEVSNNQGGHSVLAIQWWIGGDYAGRTNNTEDDRAAYSISSTSVPIETDISEFGGYYWDVIPETDGGKSEHIENFLFNKLAISPFADISERLPYAPISLNIKGSYGTSHAITLWGLEYEINSNGVEEITSMWITDSDDYTTQLRKIDTWKEDNNARLYLDYDDSWLEETIWLYQIQALNVEESDTWALQRVVPEPTTATLSLLALSGLAAHRRRK